MITTLFGLAVYAGFFLFMGATDLLPERTSTLGKRVLLTRPVSSRRS